MITTSKARLLCLAACLVWALPLAAEQPPRAELITAYRIGTTPPMANYLATHHPAPHAPLRVFPVRKPGSHPGHGGGGGGGGTSWSDSALQTAPLTTNSILGGSAFGGLSSVGYVPPDTNLSVGDTQIVETVNVDYAVYDKGGNVLHPPAPISAIFAAAGGSSICSQVDGGDPIVLYDKVDHRWIISQLAYNNSFSNNHICMAISTSDDATGSYAAYDVSFGRNLPDYPKMGIWTTGGSWNNSSPEAGVYFSANMFSHGSSFIGAQMCGFPLSGVANHPSTITWVCAQNNTGVYNILPADLEGSPGVGGTTIPAPANTAEYFMQFSGSNTLSLYQFAPNFQAGTATVSSPVNVTVAGFHEACGGGACVPQLGTSNQLDSLGDRLMYRLSYRNYGGTRSLVVTHSVQNDSSSSATGVRWYQLEKTTGNWTVAQQGTYGLNDGAYRWMGSIAQDKVGDLGIGYSISDANHYPGIAYTGRATGDTANKLEAETLIKAGAGYQTSVNRWGDYSSLSLDPTDDCTMWFATEYLKSNGSYTNWGTYITSFKFTGCN